MSNNYCQYAIELEIATAPEKVRDFFTILENAFENDIELSIEDFTSIEGLELSEDDLTNMIESYQNGGSFGSATVYELGKRELYICSECANLELLGDILSILLNSEFVMPNVGDKGILVEWAVTCDKLRPGEFGGGAFFVRKNEPVEWMSTAYDWACNL